MQRHIVIALLCCLAVVSCGNKLDVLQTLAEDSAVTTYALKKDSFVASTSSLNKHGYSSREKKHDKHGKYGEEDSYDGPHEGPGYAPGGPHNYGPYGSEYKGPEPSPHNYGPYGTEYEGHKPEPDNYDPYAAEPKGHSKHHDKHHGKHHAKHHDSYEDEEPYEYHGDDDHYVRGLYTKICLEEVSRVGIDSFPYKNKGASFTSYFVCCDDNAEAPTPLLYCNFTATPLGTPDPMIPSKVGTVSGACEFTARGKCVPERILKKPFDITNQLNATFWLVVPAALSDESYDFGVYTAGSNDAGSIKASTTAAQPEAAKPAYSVDGEYEYQPSDGPVDAKRGEAYVFSAMLASQEGLLKGGTIEFIAGFAEAKNGNILCPEAQGLTAVTPAPEGANGPLPTALCGELKLKLWWAPEEGPYEGYDGHYQHPHRYYHEDGPEEYYGEEGLYYGEEEHYGKHDKHYGKKHYKKHAKYGRKYGKHKKYGDDEYYPGGDKPEYYEHEPAEYPEGPYYNETETYTPPEEYNYSKYEP